MRAVDLIEDDDGVQANFKGLGEDKAGLRHRPFLGIDEEQNTIDKAEDPFDLAGKIGMAGGVDNIDFKVFKEYTGMFCEDCDPALFFLVVAVHYSFRDLFVVAKDIGLFKQAVEQGGFSMVDVGDDGDIANFFWLKHMNLSHLISAILKNRNVKCKSFPLQNF